MTMPFLALPRHARWSALPLLLASLLLGSPGRAQLDFDADLLLEAGVDMGAVLSCDLDEDGHLDLVVANGNDATVRVFLGQGLRTLEPRIHPTAASPGKLLAGDFDGDGHLDVVVSHTSLDAFSVLFGDGEGGLESGPTIDAQGVVPRALATGDLDEDGALDLVVSCYGRNASPDVPGVLSVFRGDGAGGFQLLSQLSLGLHPWGVAVADFDGDGHLDLAQGTRGDGEQFLHVLKGDGTGQFPRTTSYGLGTPPKAAQAVDLDQDGALDIVFATSPGLLVNYNDGTGRFPTRRNYPSDAWPSSFAVADVDRDGIQDMVAGGLELVLLRGEGNREFASEVTLARVFPRGIVLGDLDEDGALDIVASASLLSNYVLLIREGRKLLQEGDVRVQEVGNFLRQVVTADLDLDGHLDAVLRDGRDLVVLVTDGRSVPWRFAPPRVHSVTGGTLSSLAVGDVDGDGNLDVVAGQNGKAHVQLLLGKGDGDFTFADPIVTPSIAQDVALGDLDGDLNLDLIVANRNRTDLSVLAGDGTGGFTPAGDFPLTGEPTRLLLADLDLDGHLDVTVVSEEASVLDVLLGDGGLGLLALPSIPVGQGPVGLVAADLDEDGHPDIVTSNETDLSIVLGDGVGGFREPVSHGSGGFTPSAIDLDEDGHLDLVHGLDAGFQVLRGDGRGFFASPMGFLRLNDGLTAADFDEDGHADVLSFRRSEVAVLFNKTFELPEFRARRGNVNAGAGPRADVLLVNGSPGSGGSRTVSLGLTDPLLIRMEAPPSRGMSTAAFCLYAWPAVITSATVKELPAGVGAVCLPTPLSPDCRPQPLRIANNLGHPLLLGEDSWPVATGPAASDVLLLPSGVGQEASFYLQGIIQDTASLHGQVAVTNGIVVEVRP